MNRHFFHLRKWLPLFIVLLLAAGCASACAEDILPAPPVISVSGVAHGDGSFCPGAQLTVTAEAGLQSVTVAGESRAVSGNTFTAVLSAGASVEIAAVDGNGQTASRTVVIAHGDLAERAETVRVPTCTEEGLEKRATYCTLCGAETAAVENPLPALGHDYVPFESTDELCSGTAARVCARCGEPEEGTLGGHTFGEPVETPPTCGQPGQRTQTCTLCGYIKTAEIPATGLHQFEDRESTPATCTSTGTYFKVCAVCGQEEKNADGSTRVYVSPALGHDTQEEWVSNGTAHWHTCSRCDSQLDFSQHDAWDDQDCSTLNQCSVCGYVISEASAGHKIRFGTNEYDHWTYCENPGCNYKAPMTAHAFSAVDGDCTKGMTCTVCGYQTLRYGTGHAFNPMLGWQTDGETHYRACTNPGCTVRVDEEAHSGTDDGNCETPVLCQTCGALLVPGGQHDFGPWTFQDETAHARTCRNEGCAFRESAPHETQTAESVDTPASCTAAGRKTVTVRCDGCQSAVSVTEAEIPALGHDWGAWEAIGAAGCGDAGAEQRVCSRCQTAETRNLNPGSHDWDTDYTVDLSPTCTEDGSRSIHCRKCGAVKDSEAVPALGHDYSESGNTVREATCLEDAVVQVRCAWCGDTAEQTKPETALGHAFGDYRANRDASCLTGETETAVCTRCGAADTRPVEGSAPLGHLYRTDYDCTTADPCIRCGELSEKADAHEPAGQWLIDAAFGTHYQLCANPGCSQRVLEASHQRTSDSGDCTAPVYCAECGTMMETGNAYHQFGPWTDAGDTHTRACRRAGCTVTESEAHIPSFSDSNVDAAPDCTHGGHSASRIYCEVCGGVYASENAELPPLGHDFGEYRLSEAASCGKNAVETAACARCGAEDSREIPGTALEHHFETYVSDENETCTEDGTETAVCTRCGEADTRTVPGTALGHWFDDWEPTGKGGHSRQCYRCGLEIYEACAYSEMQLPESRVRICRVCGHMTDGSDSASPALRFAVAEDPEMPDAAPGAEPDGAQLLVRVLEAPFDERPDVLGAFTVCWEEGGIAVPFQGAVCIRFPLTLSAPFRLVRADEPLDASDASEPVETEITFTYDEGALTFETDREGLFLLLSDE